MESFNVNSKQDLFCTQVWERVDLLCSKLCEKKVGDDDSCIVNINDRLIHFTAGSIDILFFSWLPARIYGITHVDCIPVGILTERHWEREGEGGGQKKEIY